MESTFDLNLGTVHTAGGVALTATVTGEIDVTNASDLARSVADVAGPHPLILDLSCLRYLDSAGFAVIYRLLERHAVAVVLASDSPIHKAATLIGLTFHESVETAIDSLQPT